MCARTARAPASVTHSRSCAARSASKPTAGPDRARRGDSDRAQRRHGYRRGRPAAPRPAWSSTATTAKQVSGVRDEGALLVAKSRHVIGPRRDACMGRGPVRRCGEATSSASPASGRVPILSRCPRKSSWASTRPAVRLALVHAEKQVRRPCLWRRAGRVCGPASVMPQVSGRRARAIQADKAISALGSRWR